MSLIVALICVLIYWMIQNQKKKAQEAQRAPLYEQYECKAYAYLLTRKIFQDLVQEVYDAWEKEGALYPIGIYHETFRTIGRDLYQDHTPAEEALLRAYTFLETQGYNIGIPGTPCIEESIYASARSIPIYEYDGGARRPDRVYINQLMTGNEKPLIYNGTLICEPANDDWRRTHYLASDGTRHPLRANYSYTEFCHPDRCSNW